MNNIKWLKRKYPTSFNKLSKYFNDEQLSEFKKAKRKIGVLTKDIKQCEMTYKKGSVIQFKRSRIDSENYPFVYVVLKCELGFTQSGYHAFTLFENDFKELTN